MRNRSRKGKEVKGGIKWAKPFKHWRDRCHPHRQSEYFKVGYDACKNGLLLTDNPYARYSDKWKDWRAGWQLREKNYPHP